MNNLKSNPLSYESIKIAGMEPQTIAFNDFRIAELFGSSAIRETFDNLLLTFSDPVSEYEYWVELIYIINQLCWMHYSWKNEEYSKLYSNLYYEIRDKFLDAADKSNEGDKMIKYYWRVCD